MEDLAVETGVCVRETQYQSLLNKMRLLTKTLLMLNANSEPSFLS